MYKIRKASEADYPVLLDIWERSVQATHHFLKADDFIEIKKSLADEYIHLVDLYCAVGVDDEIGGFAGISDDKLEMLFIDSDKRGKGLGKLLLNFVISERGVSKVDVNEQNEQAVIFYQRCGFVVVERHALDSQGKEYPILEMSLE